MGVECGNSPLQFLSTHTMFKSFTCRDLSDQIGLTDAWKQENITFDAVLHRVSCISRTVLASMLFLRPFYDGNNLILVDPAMADNGSLYPAFDESFPAEMAKVCAKADIILPNITEACPLTGTPYKTSYDESYIHELLKKLLALGCHTAALTGVSYEKGRLGVVSLDRNGDTFSYFTRHCPQSYHGTGRFILINCSGRPDEGIKPLECPSPRG